MADQSTCAEASTNTPVKSSDQVGKHHRCAGCDRESGGQHADLGRGHICTDNGPELTAKALRERLATVGANTL